MKRFYKDVSVTENAGGFQAMLDERAIKTAAGAPQIVPSRHLAEALAREWAEQGDDLDPGLFHFRDLADYAIDIAGPEQELTIAKLLAFAETDTLCYRADPDEALYRRQQEEWEPLLAAFEAREGITLERVSGIMHRPQSDEAIGKLQTRLSRMDSFTLAGLQTATSLAASLCIGLAVLENDADPQALWDAANLEELWQVELWGSDYEAEDRRAKRRKDFLKAAQFLDLLRG